MKVNRKLVLSLFFFLAAFVRGQELSIGEWRDHLPYQTTHSVASDGIKVYCATNYGLFYYNKNDYSINRLTKVQGLNDIGIARIGYNQEYNTLLVAYSNTNIDLLKGNVIINMPDIYASSAITPEEKTISNLDFLGKHAYLSCGFGVVVLDIDKEEVSDTWYIGPNGSHLGVYDLAFSDTQVFAATENGIYFADLSNPNLAYFGSWTKDMSLPSPNTLYNHIAYFSGELFTNKYQSGWAGDTIFIYRNDQWVTDNELFNNNDVYGLKVLNNNLYVVNSNLVTGYNSNLEVTALVYSYVSSYAYPRDVDVDNAGLWIADAVRGLVHDESYLAYRFYFPNGPKSADVFDMAIQDEDLWVARGGRDLSWGNLWKLPAVENMIQGSWKTIDPISQGSSALDTIRDLVAIAINPYNKSQVYAGSWTYGLLEYEGQQFKTLYTPENSSLGYMAVTGPPVCKVGGMAFDNSGNMWVTNSGATNILSARIIDGSSVTWRSYYLGSQSSGKDIGNLIVDSYDQKWILWRQGYLIVFNDNGTPMNISDDQTKHLSGSQGNGGIPGTKVFSLAQDLDGEMWIGTDEGIAVIYSPNNVFSQYNFDAQRILIPRNDGSGLADILLEFETITAIAVDGKNNKWIGTDRSGVYQVSPDGLQELNHFTIENSPLLSNNITDIVINHKSGEVFFGTANGIISYKSTATEGGVTNSDVYAYPNPVRPGYNGPIAIKGLVTNADFKITDISGGLIYSGRAEGGQAIWNGTNFEGRRAQSGVYLVFVSDDEGVEKLVTKILFMN